MPNSSVTLAHHPGLKIIFFTEMWERFSFYSMRALLVLYLVHALNYSRADALALYGIYTGLVYLTPLFGGYLADRYLGQRQGAVIGGLLMLLGHFAMALPSLLHVALGLLILGNGFFKPNTTALVGQLYDTQDVRRDSAYTIFYIGINLGAFLAPLVAGSLGEKLGWHWGFVCAGIGMAIGLFVLIYWQNLLGRAGLREQQQQIGWSDWQRIGTITLLSSLGVYLIVLLWPLCADVIMSWPNWLKALIGLLVLSLVLFKPKYLQQASKSSVFSISKDERKILLMLGLTSLFMIVFWMSFEQAGGTLNLFADNATDRHIFDYEMPATWFQAINPLAIILLGPIFAMLWTRLGQSRWHLPDPAKLAFGMLTISLAFVVMAYAHERAQLFGKVGPLWLVAVYLLNTLGELMLSPIGLSMVSKLAPVRLVGLVMGFWFITVAIGNYLAGMLEQLLSQSNIPLYWFLVLSCAGCGTILLLLTPFLEKLRKP